MIYNKEIIERARKENAFLVFLHPQRTGGSRLKKGLYELLGRENVYSQQTIGKDRYKNLDELREGDLSSSTRVFAGHSDFCVPKIDRPVYYFSTVRHPVLRMRSFYAYCKEKEGHRLRQLAQENNFVDFFRHGRQVAPKYFSNLQCRRLASTQKLGKLKRLVEKSFLGIAEIGELQKLIDVVAEVLHGDVDVDVPIPAKLEEPSPTLNEADQLVLSHNQEDLALWRMVKEGHL